MGKLHSLKRAVERNPEKFMAPETYYIDGKRLALGALKTKSGWIPMRWTTYSKFVKKILSKLGYNVWTW